MMRQGIPLLCGIGAIGYWWSLTELGPAWATILFVFLAILVGLSYSRLEYLVNMNKYGNQKENIYVRNRFPTDKQLWKRKEYHEHWLAKSENQLKKPPQVKMILFQDQNHPSEPWEEYQARFVEEVKNDRLIRHQELYQSEGESWYLKHMAQQEGIIIETE